jgi:hypothetical protein
MTSPNNDRITANDGEWRQHRDKSYKRVTRRQHGKELIDELQKEQDRVHQISLIDPDYEEVDDSIFEVTDEELERYKQLILNQEDD